MFDFYENTAKIKYRHDNCEEFATNQCFSDNWNDDFNIYKIGSKAFPPSSENRCEVAYVNEGFLDEINCEKIDAESWIEIDTVTPIKGAFDTPIKSYKEHQYINNAFQGEMQDVNIDLEANIDTLLQGHNDEFSLDEKEHTINCDGNYVQTIVIKNINDDLKSEMGGNVRGKVIRR